MDHRVIRLAVFAALGCVVAGQESASPTFRYRVGDVHVAVERTLLRETDSRLGFTIATSHTTERRYTVLAVASDGTADVLVEENTGPQQLHEYLVKGRDERAAHLAKGFDAAATSRQRVLQAKFSATRFRCEPARDDPAVFYLQEIPELLAHALTLDRGGASEWHVTPALPSLRGNLQLARQGDRIRGVVQLAIADPRVHDGAVVPCPEGSVQWQFDAATGLPRSWRVELCYPRFPIDRPNVQVVTGELVCSTPLGADELARLRSDVGAYVVVRDDFAAGRFPAALQAAVAFATERPGSLLLAAMQREVEAFRRQVPRFGEVPPELVTAHWFGGEPVTLAALRGKVVVLDFWATWCVPCIAGMEHLILTQKERRGDGLCVLGLTRLDKKQTLDDVRTFFDTGYAANHGGLAIDYPLVVLADDRLHDWFAIRAIPKLVVLDRQGKVYWEQTGSGGQARFDAVLASLLQQ